LWSHAQAFREKEAPMGTMSLATCAIDTIDQAERRGKFGFSLTTGGKKKVEWKLRTVSEPARLNWITSLRSQQGTCASTLPLPVTAVSRPSLSLSCVLRSLSAVSHFRFEQLEQRRVAGVPGKSW
jgi:hypothetical protein